MNKERISTLFRNFAVRECKGSSELYEHLAMNIAQDDALLEIASNAGPGQPIPNLLFGAVQNLLLKGKEHGLREHYPNMTVGIPSGLEQAFPQFKEFCIVNKNELISLLQTKLVQTNEVRRCSYLYPSFCFIYEKVQKPLSLIEIGTSSGLLLLWDKYSYSYGSDERFGETESIVHIKSEIIGEVSPLLLAKSPPVSSRIGVDLHINDLLNQEDYLWLRSLIWPEHKERAALFEKAVSCLKEHPLEMIEGDGVALLPEIAARFPDHSALCIFHTHVANQFTKDAKLALLKTIRKLGQSRDVFHLYNNMFDSKLHLDYYINGKEHTKTIAETDGHARWFRWELTC